MNENASSTLSNNLSHWRIISFFTVVGVVFLVYILRLFTLQVLNYAEYAAQAEENRIRQINVPALRGLIYDRNGVVLARNIPSYNIVITPANLPDDPSEAQSIFRQVSALIGVPVNQGVVDPKRDPFVECQSKHGIAQIVEYGATNAPYQPVKIACDVERAIAQVVMEKTVDWPGVGVEVVPLRDYPTGSLTANIVGYLGPINPQNKDYYESLGFQANRDRVGYAGIERQYQDELGGRNGLLTVEVDVAGKVLRNIREPIPPVPGKSVRLTLDTRLQQAAEAILIDQLNYFNQRVIYEDKLMTSGVVIAMNPKTGEILAMVSYPTYENNRMARFIPAYYYEQLSLDARVPLLNHAVGDQLPVGSVFKLVTATGALNEGVITPYDIIKTPGKITIANKYFPNDPGRSRDFVDWIYKDGQNPEGFKELDVFHGIAFSSNVFFYKVGGGYEDEVAGGGLGICRLGTYARALGYGPAPDIELPDKIQGLIPDPTWKRINQGESWATGDTYISSVGQGFVIGTPLQVLMSAATIANNGKLMEPTIVKEILDSQGNVIRPFIPRLRWDLTQDAVIDVYAPNSLRGCETTGEKKTIQSWVFQVVQEGMHLATTIGTLGDLSDNVSGFDKLPVSAAGKTGTAEYCDRYAYARGLCDYGKWPSHAWTVAYAPFENPEIAVVAFVYNGNEGAPVAGPIVRMVLQSYFELKAIDVAAASP